eukprot:1651453-Rhodomonas_salina.2
MPMVGQRPKMLRPMQYLKGPGFEDFVVLVMAVLAVTFFFSDSIHWIFALALALPLFFGTLPKLRLIAEMNRRMADKRKHQPQKESQFTAASKRIRDGTLRRLQGTFSDPFSAVCRCVCMRIHCRLCGSLQVLMLQSAIAR